MPPVTPEPEPAATSPAPTSTDPTTVLAFDYGTHFVGVAVGNTVVRVAHPLTTIVGEARAERFAAVDRLVAEWAPGALVVGKPLDVDGAPLEMTARAERFARQLENRYRLPVVRVDERYTSRSAKEALAQTGASRRARAAAIDAVAAQIILQAWFDEPAESRFDAKRSMTRQ